MSQFFNKQKLESFSGLNTLFLIIKLKHKRVSSQRQKGNTKKANRQARPTKYRPFLCNKTKITSILMIVPKIQTYFAKRTLELNRIMSYSRALSTTEFTL
jgi:hypothetical protein